MTLSTVKKTLLTIVTEAVVEPPLLRDLERWGVRGYTVSDARGKGSRGTRDGAWDEAANIRIETICSRERAEQILGQLKAQYYANYAMVTFLTEIEVLRPDKF